MNPLLRRPAYYLLSAVAKPLRFYLAALTRARSTIHSLVSKTDLVRRGHLEFVLRSDDIFIVTYPRSGTTLMQMILYQLMTNGEMDFVHISERCPWFERVLKTDRNLAELPAPRIFKSHLSARWIPKGPCRYIYIARNGKDVAVSYYHLYRAYNGYKGTFPEFLDRFLRGKVGFGSWFDHVSGWWKLSQNSHYRVLFMTYEDLCSDLEASVRRVAHFCDLEVDEARLPTILQRCSLTFMKEHESKFDPVTEQLLERGLTRRDFIRDGQIGGWKEQWTAEQEQRFHSEYDRRLRRLGVDVLD